VVIEHGQRPLGRRPPGGGDELEPQTVQEHPQPLRLLLGVQPGRQLARPGRVGDPRGQRFLQAPRGVLGRAGQLRHDGHLGQEGQVDQGLFAPLGVQRKQFDGGGPQVVQRHSLAGALPDPFVDPFPDPPQGRGDQLVLVREVVPDRADRPARFGGHVGQRGPGQAVAGDDAAGGIGQLAPAGGVVDLFGHALNLALRY
jgi:hypothetical protein